MKKQEKPIGIVPGMIARCRCGHEWLPRELPERPRVCPKCKSANWDRPKLWERPDMARAKWIVVSVAGREAQVKLTPTEDGEWRLTDGEYSDLSSGVLRRLPRTRLAPFPTEEKAADHVADLIRKGVVSPDVGRHYGGAGIKRYDFPK